MPSLDKSHFCIFSFGLPRLSTDTTQTFVTQCELWKPCCCYRCFLSALLWKKSAHVTVDLTGRDLIQIKNRAALGKHSITHGVAKLVEYDNREQHCVDYLTCFLFSWLRFLISWHQTYLHWFTLYSSHVHVCEFVYMGGAIKKKHSTVNELVKRRKQWYDLLVLTTIGHFSSPK